MGAFDEMARLDALARAQAEAGEATLNLTFPLRIWRSLKLGNWVVESEWLPGFAASAEKKQQALSNFCATAAQVIVGRARVSPIGAELATAAPALVGALVELEWLGGVCPRCRRNEVFAEGQHAPHCQVDSALRQAGLVTPLQREEARAALRELVAGRALG